MFLRAQTKDKSVFAIWLLASVLIFISQPAFSSIFPKQPFATLLQPETLEAEQILSSRVPKGSDPIHLFSFLKPISMTGALPEEFTPLAAKTFVLPTILIPIEKAEVITADGVSDPTVQPHLEVELGGRKYIRLFVHPLEIQHWKMKFPDSPADPVSWLATPTSSSRSLLVTDSEMKFSPFIAKTSLNFTLAGVFRTISREQGRRAVQASAYYGEMMKATGGAIPNSDKTWTYFSESVAVGVSGDHDQLTIMRGTPADFAEVDYLAFYSLMADRGNGARWIDELYTASGYTDKLAFTWHEIVKPLLDFHAMVHIDNGMVTELHQQNAFLRVDPRTKKVLGISVRDMDGHSIDYTLRKHALGLSVPAAGLKPEAAQELGYTYARGMPMLGYEYLKDSIVKNTLRYFLNKGEVEKVVGLSNRYILERFNQKFARLIGPVAHYTDLKAAFNRVYEKITPPAEKAFFDREEASARAETSFHSRVMNSLIFRYYLIKQSLEKSKEVAEPEKLDVERRQTEAILSRIADEASGLVPKDALSLWLNSQLQRPLNYETEIPLSTSDIKFLHEIQEGSGSNSEIQRVLSRGRASAREIRRLALAYAATKENSLRMTGTATKTKLDFEDEFNVVSKLFRFSEPYWHTTRALSPSDFVGLLALPINIVGVSDKMNFADGYELPPVEFVYHDELHSLGFLAGQDDWMKSQALRYGTPAYYRAILERVRFVKRFKHWTDSLSAKDRLVAETLFFDAFHEYFPIHWPVYRNVAVTQENLLKYIGTHVSTNGRIRFLERLKMLRGNSTFNRFKPGDFLSAAASDTFSTSDIAMVFNKLEIFARSGAGASALRCSDLFAQGPAKSY